MNSSAGCASHILTFQFLPQRLLNNFLLRFHQQSLSLSLSVGKKSEPKRVSRPKQLERVSTKPWSACSFPRTPTASAQFLVNFSASFLLSGSHCSPSQMQSIALFIHAMCSFIIKPHCCLKACCRFMNTLSSWIKCAVCTCICAHIDQDRSDCKCEAQNCNCGDICRCSKLIYM